MATERMTIEQMQEKFPNMWIFIVEPETHKGTTQLKSGVVQVSSKSRDEVYMASRKFKGNAAVRFTGNNAVRNQNPKLTSYRPRRLN